MFLHLNWKIINTGDHGYRVNSDLFEPFNEFSVYWGFKFEKVDKIDSDQDIGTLISNSFILKFNFKKLSNHPKLCILDKYGNVK